MSDDLRTIVENVQRHAKQWQSVIDLANAVDKVNKLDQLCKEADARLKAKRDEEAAQAKRLDAVNVDLAKATDALAQARADAADVADLAKRDAADKAKAAQDEADRIIRDAKAAAEHIAKDSEAAQIAAQKQIDAANAQLASVNDAIAQAEREHESVLAATEKARAAIKAFVG